MLSHIVDVAHPIYSSLDEPHARLPYLGLYIHIFKMLDKTSLPLLFKSTPLSFATVPLICSTPAGSNMSSISPSEASSSLPAHARRMGYPKSDIRIHLENHFKARAYTSSSPLSGEVTITTQRDVRFDVVEIILLGSSKTRTAGLNAPLGSNHVFLKLTMPIPESLYPVPRVIEAGTTLTVPFNFVFPNFLTLNACTHEVDSDHVRDQHLRPPPSMGSWAGGIWEKDDLAPHMAEVEYCIKARVLRLSETQESSVKIMESIKPVQFIPVLAEDAPLGVMKNDRLYTMSKSKTIRKNLITAKMGELTVTGQQPRAIMLHPDGQIATGTTAQIDLKFEPVSAGISPPKITIHSSKITAHTYFSSGPIKTLSMSKFDVSGGPERRGSYSKSVNLHTKPVESVTWFTCQARRDSGYCSDTAQENIASEDDCGAEQQEQEQQQQRRRNSSTIANLVRPSKQQSPPRRPPASPVYHITTLQLPIRLPTEKWHFVPTFHTCIASRVYTLHVSLTVASGPTTSSTISVDLPIQVAVEAGAPGAAAEKEDGLPSFEDAVEDAAVDELLRPRQLGVPQVTFQGTGMLPGYRLR